MSDVIMQYNHEDFNPRPREGGRPARKAFSADLEEFQSTPPRGGATVSGSR